MSEQVSYRVLCRLHPRVDYHHHWGCPECLRELRLLLREAQAVLPRTSDLWERIEGAINPGGGE